MQKDVLLEILKQNQFTSHFSFDKVTEENANLRLNHKTASIGFIYRHIGETINLFGQFFGILTDVKNTTIGHRLVSFRDGQVTFRWRDSAHHNQQKRMTLAVDEFLRRFLLHLLPKGFVRIRHFGFLANRRRKTLLPLCFQLLGATPQPQTEPQGTSAADSPPLYRCPKCGGPMKVIARLTAAEIQVRSPPVVTAAA